MIELTIEEKAEAYDKALDRARIWKEMSGMPKDKQGILDNIFPELKESEDEKIRKTLINVFATHKDYEIFFGVSVKDILAWLEKQSNNPYNGVSFEYNGNTWGMCARDNGVDILLNRELIQHVSIEKQGEQNPIMAKSPQLGGQKSANNNEPKFHEKDWSIDDYLWQITAKEQLDVLYTKIKEAGYEWDDEKKEFKKIKNPAWSEEDEAVVKDICDKLSWLRVIYTGNQNIACQKDIYWLKSLKGRVGCEANFTTMWKPSEKQIMCLQDALSDYHRRGYKAETLETLLKQLKQL